MAPTTTRRQLLAPLGRLVGAVAPPPEHVLISVFLRGGMDGLSLLVPAGDPRYHDARPAVAVPLGAVLPVDPTFGVHPAAPRLAECLTSGGVVAVPACGLLEGSRSHFDAQADVEAAGGADGWLTRHLLTLEPTDAPVPAVALSAATPRALVGPSGALAATSLGAVGLTGPPPRAEALLRSLERLWDVDDPDLLERQGAAAVVGVRTLAAVPRPDPRPSPTAAAFADAAAIATAGLGVRAIALDIGGWDLHRDMGDHEAGDMTSLVAELDEALDVLLAGVDPLGSAVTVVVQSEFGRRVAQNDSGGTDHGRGGVVLVAGPDLPGGVRGPWPGLAELDEGDVPVATDHRVVLAEVLDRRAGNRRVAEVLPGADVDPAGYVGVTA